MSQVKIPKHQSGNKIQIQENENAPKKKNLLQFRLDGNLVSVDENEFDTVIASTQNKVGSRGKNTQDWDTEHQALKADIRRGMEQGQYFDFDLAGDRAVSVTTDMDLNNEQRGLNKKGKVARPGLFSAVTGVQKPAAIRAALIDNLGRSLAYSHKLSEEQKASDIAKAEEQARLKSDADLSNFYDRTRRAFNIGESLYGPQINSGKDVVAGNYNRFWQNPDNQRSVLINYLKGLNSFVNDNRLSNESILSRFNQDFPYDLETLRKTLSNFNLDDPNLDLRTVFDQIGLGTDYNNLMDRKYYDATQKRAQAEAAEASRVKDPSNPEAYLTGWQDGKYYVEGNVLKRGVDAEGRVIRDGVLYTGEDEGIRYNEGNPFTGTFEDTIYDQGRPKTEVGLIDGASAYDWNLEPLLLKGRQISRLDFLTDANNKSLYPQEWEQVASRRQELFDTLRQQTGDKVYGWKTTDDSSLRRTMHNPYYNTPNDVSNFRDISGQFTALTDSSGKQNKALIFEQLNTYDPFGTPQLRTKLIDETGEKTGRVEKQANGSYVFVTDENPPKRIPLGQRQEDVGNDSRWYKYKGQANKTTNQKYWSGVSFGLFKDGGKLEPTVQLIKKAQLGDILSSTPSKRNTDVSASTAFSDKDYKMDDVDYAELVGLTADVGGVIASLVPGAGNITAGALGLGSTAASTYSDIKRGEFSGTDLGLNLLLDAGSFLPVIGGLAKTGKLARGLKKNAKLLTTIFAGIGATQSTMALQSILNGDASIENFRRLASGLQGALQARKLADPVRATKKLPNKGTVTVTDSKTGDVKTVKLNQNQLNSLEGISGRGSGAKRAEFISKLGQEQGLGNASDLEVSLDRKLTNPLTWGRGTVTPNIESGRRLRTEAETNWRNRRARDRYIRTYGDTAQAPNAPSSEASDAVKAFSPNRVNFKNVKSATRQLPPIGETTRNPIPMPQSTRTEFEGANQATRPSFNTTGESKRVGLIRTTALKNLQKGRQPGVRKAAQEKLKMSIDKIAQRTSQTNVAQNDTKTGALLDRIKKALRGKPENLKTGGILKAQQGSSLNPLATIWQSQLQNLIPGTKTNTLPPSNGIGFKSGRGTLQNPFTVPEVTITPNSSAKVSTGGNSTPRGALRDLGFKSAGVTPNTTLATAEIKDLPKVNIAKSTKDVPQLDLHAAGGTNTGTKSFIGTVNPATLSEFGRTLFNMANAARVDTRVEAPLMSHAQEIIPAVKGDFLTKNAYSIGANRLRQQAGVPLTSDGSLNVAARLSANAKAGDLETQGAIANSQAVRQQEAAQTDALRHYASGRQAVANQNTQTLAQRTQAERQLNNEKRAAIAKSLDNFWANENQRAYMEQERNRGLTDQLRYLKAQDMPFGENAGEFQGQTYTEASQKLESEMNRIHAIQNKTQKDLDDLNNLRAKASRLSALSKISGIENIRNQPDPNNIKIFDSNWFKNLGGGKWFGQGVTRNAKGGRLTKNERIELEAFKSNERARRDWAKDYNRWLGMKMNADTKGAIARGNNIHDIVKLALNKKSK